MGDKLTENEKDEMIRLRSYFPFRKISEVKLPDGTCEIFANHTYAQSNNYARETGGTIFRMR